MTLWTQVASLDHPYSVLHPVRQAKAPFDNPEADIILRSSDNVEFRVFKAFLAFSSSIFKDMLSLPQASDEPQTVDLTESGSVLRLFLILCYPVTCLPTSPLEPSEIADVAETAQKYDMPAVMKYLRQLIVSPYNLEHRPFAAFAVCDRFQWREEAKTAALHTLKQRLPTGWRAEQRFFELNAISGPVFTKLAGYHSRCGAAASRVGRDLRWQISYPVKRPRHQCERVSVPRYGGGSIMMPEWLADFVEETKKAFQGNPDVESVLGDEKINSTLELTVEDCTGCRIAAPMFMRTSFVPAYKRAIEEALIEIDIYYDPHIGGKDNA